MFEDVSLDTVYIVYVGEGRYIEGVQTCCDILLETRAVFLSLRHGIYTYSLRSKTRPVVN